MRLANYDVLYVYSSEKCFSADKQLNKRIIDKRSNRKFYDRLKLDVVDFLNENDSGKTAHACTKSRGFEPLNPDQI